MAKAEKKFEPTRNHIGLSYSIPHENKPSIRWLSCVLGNPAGALRARQCRFALGAGCGAVAAGIERVFGTDCRGSPDPHRLCVSNCHGDAGLWRRDVVLQSTRVHDRGDRGRRRDLRRALAGPRRCDYGKFCRRGALGYRQSQSHRAYDGGEERIQKKTSQEGEDLWTRCRPFLGSSLNPSPSR